tara:strand:+ start:3775 stop:4134 length:360 start_codon:yes stop_codon:yes gene_type:complete
MTTQQKAVIGAIIIFGFIYFQREPKEALTASDVQPIIDKTEEAFKQAESKVLNIVPDDIEPSGPDPDPEKCICKGTGKIVQGDGHVSDCPYHSKPTSADDCEDNVKVYVPRRRGLFFRK